MSKTLQRLSIDDGELGESGLRPTLDLPSMLHPANGSNPSPLALLTINQ